MFHRYEDAYFRPLVQADSIVGLRWRVAKLRWPFAVETRVSSLGLLALGQRSSLPAGDREEAYAFFQQRLASSGFSEETSANVDYTFYTAMRLAGRLDPQSIQVAAVSWRQLPKMMEAASLFQLYMGAVLVATLEPGTVKNPLVFREVARSATKSADAFIAAASQLGLTLA